MPGERIEQEATKRSCRRGRGRPSFDSTMAIRRDPYRFIRRTAEAQVTDAFETRLLLERTLFVTGAEAARFFYDGTVFKRDGAAPEFLKSTLFGRGGVQGLDGPAHHHRKEMFLRLFGRGRTGALTETATAAIREALQTPGAFALQDRMEEVLTAAVSAWAGLPVSGSSLPGRTRMISNLFEHAAPINARHILARLARRRADRWAASLIEDVRAERWTPPPQSALAVIAKWHEPDGEQLPSHVAAVELLNALRPVVAVSAYITFAAHALATRPEEVEALRADAERLPCFVQEVRRTYPFFPMLAARVRQPTTWRGFDLPPERLVVLDIWGTNRDPSAWSEPGRFDPERFRDWDGNPFTLIPQGGGDHAKGHRCPGEWVTRDLMETATRALLDLVDWQRLPDQDLSLDMRNLPALPRDRLRLDPR